MSKPTTDSDDADESTPNTNSNSNSNNRLTAAKRKAARYGADAKETVTNTADRLADSKTAHRSARATFIGLIVAFVATNPTAAQACDSAAGMFISDMQTQTGQIILGAMFLASLVGLGLILVPFGGTAQMGWVMLFAVGAGLFGFMLIYYVFGMVGDYGVMGMGEACSPFF